MLTDPKLRAQVDALSNDRPEGFAKRPEGWAKDGVSWEKPLGR
jgi:hypothetical protein